MSKKLMIEAMYELIKHGTHMEYDFPSEAPEECGMYCDICKQHINDNNLRRGHDDACIISRLAKAVESA